jgi:hypothetical protein
MMEEAASKTVKERPVLFSGPMVRAILEGRKTQTRRVVKPQPVDDGRPPVVWNPKSAAIDGMKVQNYPSPYGYRGDRLWVRETWRTWAAPLPVEGQEMEDLGIGIEYLADDGMTGLLDTDHIPYEQLYRLACQYQSDMEKSGRPRSRPYIHLPRWASRLLLEITDVRVERLQDISEEDAIAEGLYAWDGHGKRYYGIQHADVWETDPRKTFARLWDSINGKKHPWSSNPYVGVVTFRPISPTVSDTVAVVAHAAKQK